MSELDSNRLLTLLGEARHPLGQLHGLKKLPDDAILSSADRLGNLKYQWIVLMEACIDMCNHLSARLFGKAPESYAGCFEMLRDSDVLGPELSTGMAELARFRNVLVHLYWNVDDKRVIDRTRNRIGVVEQYLGEIAKIVQAGKKTN